MKQILCGKLGNSILVISKTSRYPMSVISIRSLMSGRISKGCRPLLASPHVRHFGNPNRGYAMLVARVLRGALKVRYLLLGGAVGGGVTLQKKYEEWKRSLPNTDWIYSILPTDKQWEDFRESLLSAKTIIAEKVEIDPRIKQLGEAKYQEYKSWLNQRLDDAIKAADTDETDAEDRLFDAISAVTKQIYSETKEQLTNSQVAYARPLNNNNNEEEQTNTHSSKQRMDAMQEEMMQMQLKYQRELERLERENKELRKQMLLRGNQKLSNKKIKKSLIDMYSDVLDELQDYDSGYSLADHLPRVVVVGDQSSGKTSVLEMIAQARIFPRGGGEMMTRAPVKVTLSEGPYHIAQFRDSSREFDLSKESELADLRREIELRMKNSIKKGKTVSQEVISMTVKGPGLQRMVLVDLPGIISTVTIDMAEDTRDAIRQMTQQYMSNPNAIILCIQDGSVDAERSNVTDLVSQMDPTGRRTIFVLTKVDMAEKNSTNPERLRKILSGKLFPMKALGYFAVVTGRGKPNDSIQTIKNYEENFFRNSKLFNRDDLALSSQVTTKNLSLAVAECFWKMVRETIEQQADAFKATRFNLETEWKNNFPRLRELDRDELFEKARGEILDEIINLSQLTPKHWEELLLAKIWDKVSNYVFENIYVPAAQSGNPSIFNTSVDIKLRVWTEQQLLARSVESGWECFQEEMYNFINQTKLKPDHDGIFDHLKNEVIAEAMKRHSWEEKATEMLKVIQFNTLEDKSVNDKRDWDQAVRFLENSVKEKLKVSEEMLYDLLGPGRKERWLYWKSQTEDQQLRTAVKNELDKLLYSNKNHTSTLGQDELTAVRKNLQRNNLEVDNDYVQETWRLIYRRYFLQQSLAKAYDCKKGYYLYHTGHESEADCNDVVLFWRIQQMLKVTANALRQQIMNREARRLYREIKEVMEDFSQDNEIKEKLLTGRRVILAEELKRVRHIQEKLEEFIQALNQEK